MRKTSLLIITLFALVACSAGPVQSDIRKIPANTPVIVSYDTRQQKNIQAKPANKPVHSQDKQ